MLKLKNLLALVVLTVSGLASCTSSKTTSASAPYVEFKRPNQIYQTIDFAVPSGGALYYLNQNTARNYVLWCVNAESLVLPEKSELPEGFTLQKVTYPQAITFHFHYRHKWSFIMDNHYNVYVRVH